MFDLELSNLKFKVLYYIKSLKAKLKVSWSRCLAQKWISALRSSTLLTDTRTWDFRKCRLFIKYFCLWHPLVNVCDALVLKFFVVAKSVA